MPERTRHRPLRRIPAVVLAATVAFGALAALWSVAVPLLEAPDEPDHLALVLHLADGHDYPAYDGLQSQAAILRLCRVFASSTRACPREGEPVTATSTRRHPRAEAPDKAARPAWDDAGGATPVGRLNQMPQHPPLYYQSMAAVLRVERAIAGGPRSLDQELALLRLVNAVLVAPLPLLAWWAARRFGLDDATAIGASLAVFGLPMLTHIGSTLNNDNLLTLCGAVLAALLAGVARGDRSGRTAVAIGVTTGIGLLTKAFAIVFPPLIVLAYLIGIRSGPRAATRWRPALVALVRPLAAAGAATAALAGWWYVGVRLRTGRFAPTIEDQRFTTALRPPGFRPGLGHFTGQFLPLLEGRTWGSYGWYSVRITAPVAHLSTAIVAVAVASALATRVVPGSRLAPGGDRARDDAAVGQPGARPPSRLATASLLAPVALLLAFVFVRAWGLHETTSKYLFIQGRYLFAAVVGVAVVVAVGVRRVAGPWSPFVLAGLAALSQAEGLRRVLASYWGGPGLGPRGQARALVAYSGWPGEVLGLGAVLSLLAAAWLAWELVALARRGGAEVGDGPEPEQVAPVGSIAP